MIEEAESETYYYHYDALGSVVALSDSSGDTVQTYEYSVYGQPAVEDINHPNPYMFAGRRFDIEIGLYYNRARYYNPFTGRFLQADPLGYEGGINMYRYCSNNPLNLLDPLGLCPTLDPYYTVVSDNDNDPMNYALVQFTLDPCDPCNTWKYKFWDWVGDAADATLKALHIGLDVAGCFDPTPATDFIHGVGLAGEAIAADGSWTDVGLTFVAINPFGGDTGKGAKYIDEIAAITKPKWIDEAYTLLKKSLASMDQVSNPGIKVAGKGLNTNFRDALSYARRYGGNPDDWYKMTSRQFVGPDGMMFQTHWVENVKTGQRLNFKTVITQWMEK